MDRTSPEESCIICNESLQILVDSDDEETSGSESHYVYDDVELPCGHHLHYDCARDLHAQSRAAITSCPSCQNTLLTNGTLLVTIRNEGGVTTRFDLGQDLEEQRMLQENPELARNEAFLSFCFASDHEAMADLLTDGAQVDAVQKETGMRGLHLCALNNDAQGIALLLRAGADREGRSLDGNRPLDIAISEGSHDAAYALQQ